MNGLTGVSRCFIVYLTGHNAIATCRVWLLHSASKSKILYLQIRESLRNPRHSVIDVEKVRIVSFESPNEAHNGVRLCKN